MVLLSPTEHVYPVSGDTDPQVSHSDQVVGNYRQGEVPVDFPDPSVAGLAKQADCLEPAENLLYSFAELLTYCITAMPGGAAIDR